MFDQTTSCPTPNAISSPASGCGPTPFAAPAGQMIDLFGPVPVLANLSPRQARELGLMTSGTSGRTSIGSSASSSLQSSLESRLRAKTQTLGSTLYRLTWKPWRTPSGPSRSRLRASVLRTSATGSTGWPTPTAMDANRGAKDARPWDTGRPLNQIAALAGWGTPTASECGGSAERFLERKSQLGRQMRREPDAAQPSGAAGRVGDTDMPGPQGRQARAQGEGTGTAISSFDRRPGPANGFWADADWLFCRDGKWRPVEPGTFPLADGAPARVGRLRAYGNAINAEAAIAFIQCAMNY